MFDDVIEVFSNLELCSGSKENIMEKANFDNLFVKIESKFNFAFERAEECWKSHLLNEAHPTTARQPSCKREMYR